MQWSDTGELYERPYVMMHPVLFDGEAEPVMVSDRRMTDGQDHRREHVRDNLPRAGLNIQRPCSVKTGAGALRFLKICPELR